MPQLHANLSAFLRVIRAGESSQSDDAYTVMYGGSHFDSFDDHPRQAFKSPWGWTSAAGAYQAMCAVPGKVKTDTWGDFIRSAGPHDFSPESQDKFAVWCIKRRGALDDVLAGRIETAVQKCAKEWASLPGSPYGQPTRTLQQALATYAAYGGALNTSAQPVEKPAESEHVATEWELNNPAPAPQPKAPMAPFIIPAVVELARLIPKLGGMFGGSEVAQRNVAAAGVVVDAVVGAVGAANAQEAVEKIAADPVAREAANKAVDSVWYQITTEAGGGGIKGAGERDAAAQATGSIRKSASFWIALLLLPLVYLLVLSLIGLVGTATWSDDVRAGLAGSLISAIVGGLVGYYYGQTTSRNRGAQ